MSSSTAPRAGEPALTRQDGCGTDALQLVFEHAPALIAMLDRDLRYVAVSRRFATDLRLGNQSLIGRRHYDVFPSIPESMREAHQRCLAGAVERGEHDALTQPDGTVHWLKWEARPWHDAGGEIRGIVIFGELLTEKMSALKALRASEELLRSFFDQSALGFAQVAPQSGRMLRVNDKMCQISGRSREELLERSWQEMLHPGDVAAASDAVGRFVLGHEKSFSVEVRFLRGGGEVRWVRATATRMDLPDGAITLIAAAEDITDRKRTENALVEAERRLATVFRVAPVPIAVLRWSDRRYVEVNDAFTAVFGWSHEEVVGKTADDLGIEPGRANADTLSTQLVTDGTLSAREVVLRRKTGEDITCLASVGFAEIGGERCAIGFFQDVTPQRANDQALRRSEAELRAMFDVAPVGFAQTDPESGRFVHVNPRMCEITGYEAHELYGMSVREITHPDDAARHDELYGAVARGERTGYRLEKRYVCKGGRVAWVNVNLTVLYGLRDRKLLFAAVEDITERRAAQSELELQMRAFQAADNGIVVTDAAGVVLRANAAVSNLTGYEEAELIGQTLRRLDSGEQSQEFYRELWETIRAGLVWRGELVNRKKDGSHYHEEQTITPVRGARGEITHFIAIKNDVSARKLAEVALADAKDQQRVALDAAGLGVWRHEIARLRMQLDARAMAHFGFDRPDVGTQDVILRVHPDDRDQVRRAMASAQDPLGDGQYAGEHRLLLPSGEVRWLSVSVRARFAGTGTGRHAISSIVTSRDVTDAKRAEQLQRDTEQQLRAAQKMEAVGRLAGGVAHDFNNLLSVILSYAEVAAVGLRPDDPLHADLGEIVRAAQRAEALTEQLLAFSRHQVWRPQSVDLNVLVQGIGKMLRRLIGEDIDLDVVGAADLFRTRADPGQIEQVLMNLAVNARDAMPDGGRLAIGMVNVEVDAARAASLEIQPGPYVALTVSDTGCGMDPATLARIFDPFFTTKGIGKGTGLGLSTVYGIIRQSGGAVVAQSAPNAGATFRIYLKRDEGEAERPKRSAPPLRAESGGETVLVVEDEEALRNVVQRVLKSAGYDVITAANAGEALHLSEQRGSDIRLVLTDVIMPGMNGQQLVQRLFPRCPLAKIVFMSGYTDDAIERLDVLGHDFLRKPFSGDALVRKVRAVLNATADA